LLDSKDTRSSGERKNDYGTIKVLEDYYQGGTNVYFGFPLLFKKSEKPAKSLPFMKDKEQRGQTTLVRTSLWKKR